MQVSNELVGFVGRHETFEPFPYNDPAGHATIGYGHLLHRGPVTEVDRTWAGPSGLSETQGVVLLRQDLRIAEAAIQRYVYVLAQTQLQQHEFDALASFIFNVGVGDAASDPPVGFAGSTLLTLLNAGHKDRVPEELLRWVYAGGKRMRGLVKRRVLEAAIWVAGVYA